jgi:hypothetical protein
MENTIILKIFLGSPSDVNIERNLIFNLQNELNHLIGKPNNLRFEFVNWEKDAYPGIGIDAQDVINKAIHEDFDIFIGIFWLRFGTKTNRAESGTEEEFEIAYNKFLKNPEKNHIMMYFKTASPTNIYDLDSVQFEKVKIFKESLKTKGLLFWEFETPENLKNLLLMHFASLIQHKFSKLNNNLEVNGIKDPIEKDKYELLAEKIDSSDNEIDEIVNMFELLEQTIESMHELPIITEKITYIINGITLKFIERTKQVNILNHIKDERLKVKKSSEIADKLSIDLDNYSKGISDLLPEFSEKMNQSFESYSKILISAKQSHVFENEIKEQIENVYPILKRDIVFVLDSVATFLNAISNLPSITYTFGKAKRKAELATNSIFKEFINSRNLLNQITT